MSTHEPSESTHPSSQLEQFFPTAPEPNIDRISRQLEMIETVVHATNLLRSSERPTRFVTTYDFPKHVVNPDIFPDSIRDFLMIDQLGEVTVDIVTEEDEWVAFSLVVTAGGREFYISRDPQIDFFPEENTAKDTLFIREKDRPVGKVSVSDLNRVILGLVTGQPVNRETDLSHTRLVASGTAEALRNAFEQTSPSYTEDYQYNFGAKESPEETICFRITHYQVSQTHTELFDEISVTYPTLNPDRRIRSTISIESGLSLKFETLDSGEGTNPFNPTPDDIDRLYELIKAREASVATLTEEKIELVAPDRLASESEEELSHPHLDPRRYGNSPDVD